MVDKAFPLPPGSVIGIFGGGQLGRMLALAAAPLGYNCYIYAPGHNLPATQVAAAHMDRDYGDLEAVREFAKACDVITFEFENIPVEAVEEAAAHCPVCPGANALHTARNRAREKTFFNGLGAETAPWAPVTSLDDLRAGLAASGTPAILKTAELGYDGKGQARIDTADKADAAWRALTPERIGGAPPAVLEGFVDFAAEASVIAARSRTGEIAVYDLVRNQHRDHILDTSTVPGGFAPVTEEAARDIAERALLNLEYVGVLAIELFVMPDNTVRVNEMAPRVHNSGHWSIDAAVTSQFEQAIRATAGLPLGSTALTGAAEMTNLIGDGVRDAQDVLKEPGTHLHLYGKGDVRPGRKMGHITRVKPL